MENLFYSFILLTDSSKSPTIPAMGFGNKIGLAVDIAASRIFGHRKPLVVAWSITNRCNRECLYCDSKELPNNELKLSDGLLLLEQIAKSGVRIVSFTGGEPLIHKNIADYIIKVRTLGMGCGINSNGVLVRKNIDVLKNTSFIKLSLDGEPSVHDEIRGGNCAKYVFDALEACKEQNISSTILTVLSSKNLDQIPYLIDVAEKYNITVYFQPATGHALKSERDNPVTPSLPEYKACINQIINAKKGAKGKYIGNSVAGLSHLKNWPDPIKMKCEGLRVSARIEPDGRVYHCGRMIRHMKGPDALKLGFAEAFKNLKEVDCDFCWCAHRVETNLILGLEPSAVWEALKAKLF